MGRQGLTSMASFERALGALLVLNLFDAALTSVWVSSGITGEGNPMMAAAIALGYGPFVLGNHLGIGARVVGLVERGLFFGGQLPG